MSRACRGVRPLSGLVSAIRRAEVLRHAGQYRELSTPVGTAGNDPSQTWHRVRQDWNFAPALAATQHRPRLLAPARQLVCRRDQRLLPRRVGTPIAPANHRSGTASGYNSIPEASASQVTSIRVAYGSAGHQLARSDHPGLYESAVGEVCCFKTCCSDHPGLSESAVG